MKDSTLALSAIILGLSDIFVAALVIVVSYPLLKRKVKMNRLYGVRFARSFESDELWYEINEYGARRLILWSAVLLAIGVAGIVFPIETGIAGVVLLALAPLLYLIPCWEAHRFSRRL